MSYPALLHPTQRASIDAQLAYDYSSYSDLSLLEWVNSTGDWRARMEMERRGIAGWIEEESDEGVDCGSQHGPL